MTFNQVDELIQDIRQGKMVILVDDEDRENEGDLVMAASLARPEDINFMARFGRGLICLTLTRERCQQLRLPLMVHENTEHRGTKFTISVDASQGVSTGISAQDRAATVRAAVAADAKPADLVQPGHIFPLMAEPGGVLTRAGHTEAGCDLARLAGMEPAAVIVEVLNEDGTMARRPDLEVFAKGHDIKIGTIAELIQYRVLNEKTVERVAECHMPTEYGDFRLFAFQDTIDNGVHLAMVAGEIQPEEPTLVRVHVQDCLCDLTGNRRDDCGWPLADALRRIAESGQGVAVILRHPQSGDELVRRLMKYQSIDAGEDVRPREHSDDLRTVGTGSQILMDLGVRKMRVLSAPKRLHGISGFGLEVVEYVS